MPRKGHIDLSNEVVPLHGVGNLPPLLNLILAGPAWWEPFNGFVLTLGLWALVKRGISWTRLRYGRQFSSLKYGWPLAALLLGVEVVAVRNIHTVHVQWWQSPWWHAAALTVGLLAMAMVYLLQFGQAARGLGFSRAQLLAPTKVLWMFVTPLLIFYILIFGAATFASGQVSSVYKLVALVLTLLLVCALARDLWQGRHSDWVHMPKLFGRYYGLSESLRPQQNVQPAPVQPDPADTQEFDPYEGAPPARPAPAPPPAAPAAPPRAGRYGRYDGSAPATSQRRGRYGSYPQ